MAQEEFKDNISNDEFEVQEGIEIIKRENLIYIINHSNEERVFQLNKPYNCLLSNKKIDKCVLIPNGYEILMVK